MSHLLLWSTSFSLNDDGDMVAFPLGVAYVDLAFAQTSPAVPEDLTELLFFAMSAMRILLPHIALTRTATGPLPE